MSSINQLPLIIVLVAGLMFAGCSKPNENTPVDPNSGLHLANWYVDHRIAFAGQADLCKECHGQDLHGGVSGVSCFRADLNGRACHASGPGHPAGWANPASHGAAAKSAPGASAGFAYCEICHGADFTGGTVNKSCFTCHGVNAPHSPKPWRGGTRTHTSTSQDNAAVCGQCHRNPAAPVGTASGCFNNTLCHNQNVGPAHSVPFTDKTLHGPTARADLASCEPCHATPFNAGAGGNPRFNIAKGNLANGCESCHPVNTAHPNNQWLLRGGNTTTHLNAGNLNACKLCHGVNLNGVGGVGPSCVSGSCHAVIPVGVAACTSCHVNPPATGKHSKHNGLANVTGVCAACHTGAGTGTTLHANGTANVGISATYQAKTGAAAGYAANVCSNTSCHGGQSINWLTGTINVNTECIKCHRSRTTSDQYNAYFSGEHGKHVSAGVFCYECHDTTKLATSHFSGLNTSAMSGAFQTIITAVNYTGNGTTLGSCTINCHSVGANKTQNHSPEGW